MPQRPPDRNKRMEVKVTKTIRVDDRTYFKGTVETDEVTAQRLRRELRRPRAVRPYVEESLEAMAADEGTAEDADQPPADAEPKAKEHL